MPGWQMLEFPEKGVGPALSEWRSMSTCALILSLETGTNLNTKETETVMQSNKEPSDQGKQVHTI